jgi:hypothetical protein
MIPGKPREDKTGQPFLILVDEYLANHNGQRGLPQPLGFKPGNRRGLVALLQ